MSFKAPIERHHSRLEMSWRMLLDPPQLSRGLSIGLCGINVVLPGELMRNIAQSLVELSFDDYEPWGSMSIGECVDVLSCTGSYTVCSLDLIYFTAADTLIRCTTVVPGMGCVYSFFCPGCPPLWGWPLLSIESKSLLHIFKYVSQTKKQSTLDREVHIISCGWTSFVAD